MQIGFSGISYIGNTGRISFLLYDNFAFYKIDCFILNNRMYNILLICDTLKKGESDKGELEKMDK